MTRPSFSKPTTCLQDGWRPPGWRRPRVAASTGGGIYGWRSPRVAASTTSGSAACDRQFFFIIIFFIIYFLFPRKYMSVGGNKQTDGGAESTASTGGGVHNQRFSGLWQVVSNYHNLFYYLFIISKVSMSWGGYNYEVTGRSRTISIFNQSICGPGKLQNLNASYVPTQKRGEESSQGYLEAGIYLNIIIFFSITFNKTETQLYHGDTC